MTVFPLRYARQNLLVGQRGEAAGLYRVGLVSYPYLPAGEKWRVLRRLERFCHTVGADFSLWRVSRGYPAARYTLELDGLLDARHGDSEAWRRYLQGHTERLAGLASHTPELYLAVSLLGRDGRPPGRGLVGSVDWLRRRVEELTGVGGTRPLSGQDLEALAVAEQRTFERLGGVLRLRRASTAELQWLLRRAELRGVGEPRLERFWQPDALVVRSPDGAVAYEPLEHELWHCANAPVFEDPSAPPSLVVEAERAASYQAFLCVGALPEEAEFPGAQAELLFAPLEGVGFPVDAVAHLRWIGNRDALSQVRRAILDAEHNWREQAQGAPGGPGWHTEEDRVLAREYEAVLQSSGRPPMLRGWISLAVGAPNRPELERRVTALRERYGDVELHRPRGLQERLFFEHLPRADAGRTVDYRAQLTCQQLAAMVPIATERVGSDRGIYVGYTPSGTPRPVRYDPTAPSREARASAVLLAGTLGSGKTVAAEAIAHGAQRRGSLVIDFDPRPDHGFHHVPGLKGRVQVLELSGDRDQRGVLDPLRIGLPELREELCSSYLLELLRDPPPAWENAIQRAVRDVVRHRATSTMDVISALAGREDPAAREAADALEVLSDFGAARLGFATGQQAPIEAALAVTTIRTPGLALPKPGVSRETYTRAERVSVATLSLVAALALRLVAQDRSRHKLVLLDEAWFLLTSSSGLALVNRLVRLARAFNATVLLATQQVADLGDLSDLIGTYFIFGQESDAEARRALDLLGLDPDDHARVSQLKEQRQGRCLMRDLDGRIGEVQIDLPDPELLDAFDTTPKAARA